MNHPEHPLPEDLQRLIEAHHRPPDTPREAIWSRIEAARGRAAPGAAPDVVSIRQTPRWAAWVTGIAALLLVGIGLGRLSVGPGADPAVPTASAPAPSVAMTVATTQHLSRIETLLTGLRTGGGTGAEPLAGQATELLGTTRLFLDAPGLTDPTLRRLLEDLELILVQVVRLQETGSPDELEFITDGLDEHQVMPRLQRAIPAGPIRT